MKIRWIKEIIKIDDNLIKKEICRTILEALPDWFAKKDGREKYISNCVDEMFFAAKDNDKTVGFLCIKETSKDTVELSVMGILKEYQHRGIGTDLFNKAIEYLSNKGYSFIQVKTVQMGYYESYDKTNMFYKSLGFKELEILPNLWDRKNPCQIYIMAIR